jgi:hypothetical protein
MPAFLEKDLEAEAKRKGFSGEQEDHYVYGALNNRGYMRGNKITAKGEALDAKHASDMRMKSQHHAFGGMK